MTFNEAFYKNFCKPCCEGHCKTIKDEMDKQQCPYYLAMIMLKDAFSAENK